MRINMSKFYFYKRKLEGNFFEGFDINLKSTQYDILLWMYNLSRYENIEIDKFSYLFNKYNNMYYPLKVRSISGTELDIQDGRDERCYFCYDHYGLFNNKNVQEYCIGRRVYPYDDEYVYKIVAENEILLKGRHIIKLNEDYTNTNTTLSFEYNYNNSICVVFEDGDLSIKLVYTSENIYFDDGLVIFFFNNKFCISDLYNALSISKRIKNILDIENFSINILYKSELISEINVVDDFVTKYCFTEIISDYEMIFHKITSKKHINEF